MLNESRYISNDWLEPIAEKAQGIFCSFDRDSAIDIAAGVHLEMDIPDIDIPWVVSFPSDSINQLGHKLLSAAQTPDGQTPYFDARFQEPIAKLKKLLEEEQAIEGMIGLQASYHLLTVAGGHPGENLTIYRDKARRWPQYAHDWREKLIEQFGSGQVDKMLKRNFELARFLADNERIAYLDYERQGELAGKGESTPEFIERVFTSFEMIGDINLGTEDGLRQATKLLSQRQEGYRVAAYNLRGLVQ